MINDLRLAIHDAENTVKIVVDAMGGDYAPANIVAGVIEAVKEYKTQVTLVGIEDRVREELKKHSFPTDAIEIIHAPEVVEMDDPPVYSIRQKRNCSISAGINLLKKPGYDAFISAGNTGAVVASATFNSGLISGVDRPAIGIVIPTLAGFSFMIDVGANTAAKPEHLLQSALMARVYAREVMGIADPTVGLLNIGTEEGKGTGFEKEAYKLLNDKVPNFIGNIEANEVFTGKCSCIVCDGFVGNITLKVSEGLIESASHLIRREIKKHPIALFGALFMRPFLQDVRSKVDYSEYGGAPLLGVNGIVMISHGRSTPKAIKNAIRSAMREVEHNMISNLEKEVSRNS